MRPAALLVLLLATSATVSAPRLKPTEPDDKRRLVGTWAPEEGKPGGVTGFNFVFRADGTCGLLYNGGKETPATYTLDLRAKPRVLAWNNSGSTSASNCRYAFDGDRLTLCFYSGAEPPPTLEPGPGVALYYLKRVKE